MRTILIATGYRKELEPLVHYRPSPLLNVAGKPIIFHIIEALIEQGIKQFDLVLHHLPEQIEERLEEGKRWGIEINYHIVKDANKPFTGLSHTVKQWKNETILFGQGDEMPELPFLKPIKNRPLYFTESEKKWTGWALLQGEMLQNSEILNPDLTKQPILQIKPFLSAFDLKKLVKSNEKVITQKDSPIHFPTTSKKVESGIWISRAVILEPGVKIIPPVFIGESTHIKSGAQIGPAAVIESHTIIDSDSTIEHSIVCQNSYIGEGLEINHCIVDRNSLISLTHGTSLNILDDHLLSSSSPSPLRLNIFERGFALILFFLLLPIYLWKKASVNMLSEEKVSLPSEPNHLKTFQQKTFMEQGFFRRLPALLNIIKGEIHFFGVPPRSPQEVAELPPDWQKLYLQSKAGLITLEDVDYGTGASDDERYAAEVYYSIKMGGLFDIKLLFRWFYKKLKALKKT